MATLHLTKNTTVEALRNEFFDNFGAQLRVYNGNKKAEMGDTLGNLGLTAEGEFECRSSITAASFIDRMAQNYGLKVKVYTCDEWVAVLDGLTLESAGKVKKNAVKADMESMIAYQRAESDSVTPTIQVKKSAKLGDFNIDILADNKVVVKKGGTLCDNAKGALREIAETAGFVVDPGWNTQQFGSKLVDFIKGKGEGTIATAQVDAEKAKADMVAAAAAEKVKSEAAAAQAELERIKAEAAAAKAEAEKAKAEAEKAKAAAAKAEAEKAKAEAEKAKAAAAKSEAEAARKKTVEAPKVTVASKSNSEEGALCGVFSVGENKKVRFSKGNLQFNAKKYEFRFAEHQWDTISKDDNMKVSPTYDGWIDIFGYGTSGYMGCQPYESSVGNKHYPNQDINGTNYDWGVYNPISNGGNKEGLWRTMTKEEWGYLLQKRPYAVKLNLKGTVNGKEGMILLPDDFYEKRIRIPIDSTPYDYSANSYSGDTWNTLENVGAVFRPKHCCFRYVDYEEDYYFSWTATNPYIVNDENIRYSDPSWKISVRLVQDVK